MNKETRTLMKMFLCHSQEMVRNAVTCSFKVIFDAVYK